MGVFRTGRPSSPAPESPAALFDDLRRAQGIKYLWAHQAALLEQYYPKHLDAANVALELPTGAGKTLIGLLIAEYRRRARRERVVYLCPTKQLCNQVKAQADSYGINCSLLIGPQRDYPEYAFSAYQRGDAVGLTTYNGIFNIKPKIDDAQVIVCDDAHAADGHIADLWALRVQGSEHPDLFRVLVNALLPAMTDDMRRRVGAKRLSGWEQTAVDLVPAPKYSERLDEIAEVLEVHCTSGDLYFRWQMLRSHLEACNIYVSRDSILIRPVIAPSLTHVPFAQARQRVFMSATLGAGGELERSTGIPRITRLPVPPGWERRGTGRRLILFPNLITDGSASSAIERLVADGDRSLVLVKDNRTADKWAEQLGDTATVLRAGDIEEDLESFTSAPAPAALVLANRYDGLDLPGDTCRRLVLVGLPAASDLQELFFRECLGAFVQLRDRVRTRVTQGMGRCTRDEMDYSLVLLADSDLLKWCCTNANVRGMHPELQAEIEFGIENSGNLSMQEFEALWKAFFERGTDWEEADARIIELRNKAARQEDSSAEALERAAGNEVEFIYAMWRRDFEKGHERAVAAVEALSGGDELRPYRAYWYYAGCVAAWLSWISTGDERWFSVFREHLTDALACTVSVQWLAELRTIRGVELPAVESELATDARVVAGLLEDWQLKGVRFQRELQLAREAIGSTTARRFQSGMETLGTMLGCYATSWPDDGAPDGLWVFNNGEAVVFEYKSDESPEDPISLTSVRQALTHETWARERSAVSDGVTAHTVIVTPRSSINRDAKAVCDEVRVVDLEDVRELFEKTARVLTELRSRAQGISDEELRDLINERYSQAGLTHRELLARFLEKRLRDLPIPGKA